MAGPRPLGWFDRTVGALATVLQLVFSPKCSINMHTTVLHSSVVGNERIDLKKKMTFNKICRFLMLINISTFMGRVTGPCVLLISW